MIAGFLKRVGTVELFREMLNMSIKTAVNCSQHVVTIQLEIPPGPAALHLFHIYHRNGKTGKI